MDEISFRPLSEEEMPAASELIRQVFMEFEAPDYTSEGIETFFRYTDSDAMTARLRSGEMRIWGAFSGERLTGALATREACHISLLFVDKTWHRRGIARSLFYRFLDAMRTEYRSRVTVNAAPWPLEIYKRLGFIPTAPEQNTDGIRYTPMEYFL